MRVLQDDDADLSVLQNKTVAIIGYGNQGRAQALNLRDSGIRVLIGSIRDAGAEAAERDGFRVVSLPEACDAADALALLIPDEVQREVYHAGIDKHVVNAARRGQRRQRCGRPKLLGTGAPRSRRSFESHARRNGQGATP